MERSGNRVRGRSPLAVETGASVVELAIIGPLLLILALGAIEFGLLMAHAQTMSNAARAGARAGSATIAGVPSTDYQILEAVRTKRALGEEPATKVIVYKAETADGSVPPQCLGASQPGLCNLYSGNDARNPTKARTASISTSWLPGSRVPGEDFVGVWVESDHSFLTGLFGRSRTVADSVVMRIEPGLDPTDVDVPSANATTTVPPTTPPTGTEEQAPPPTVTYIPEESGGDPYGENDEPEDEDEEEAPVPENTTPPPPPPPPPNENF